jgi:hypothetical protein
MIDWFVYLSPLLLLPIVLLPVFIGCEGRISVAWHGHVVLLLTYNPAVSPELFPNGSANLVTFDRTINGMWHGPLPPLRSPTVLSDGSHEFRYEDLNQTKGLWEVECHVYYSDGGVDAYAVSTCAFEYDGHAMEVVFRVTREAGSLRVSCSVI